jgi:protein-tyrosine phosphatase
MSSQIMASEIVHNIFVGGERDCLAPEVWDYKVVINVTDDVPFSKLLARDVKTFRIPIKNTEGFREHELLLQNLPTACELIRDSLEMDANVLIHCAMGQQRSCAVACGYLIFEGMTYDDSVKCILNRRPVAFANGSLVYFKKSLLHWEQQCASVE